MRVFSAFAGVEGLGMKIPNQELVGLSEWDKYASMVLKYHYPNVKNYGDISKINWEEVPDFDMLTGGSPCQDFSIAGKRRGLAGHKSSLAWEYIRALQHKKPRYFIWENVEGTLSSNGGWDFANLLVAFSEVGYSLQWQLFNARNFGVPQNRSRIYVTGTRTDIENPQEVLFEFQSEAESAGETIKQRISNTLTKRNAGGGNRRGNYIRRLNNPTHSRNRVYSESGIAPTLDTAGGGGRQPYIRVTQDGFHLARNDKKKSSIQGTHVTFPEGKSHALNTNHVPMVRIPEATKKGYSEATVGQAINISFPTSATRRGRVSDVAQTLDRGMQQYTLTADDEIRRITPLECERLMGWPDDWTRWGIDEKGKTIEISDTQRYAMCGNGAVPDLAEAIVKYVMP